MAASLCLVAAVSRNGVIGANGGLPWRLTADLAHFRRVTLDRTILMGRKTWESLPRKLDRRRCFVLSRARVPGDCISVGLIEEAVSICDEDELLVIGGASVYAQTIDLADRMLLTWVHADVQGDAHFPELDDSWGVVGAETHEADARNAYKMTFMDVRRVASDNKKPVL